MIANVRSAKARLSELLQRAAAGEEIVIAAAGRPKAKLVGLGETTSIPFRVNRALLTGPTQEGGSSRAPGARGAGRQRLIAGRVYLDTAILVKLLVREADSDFYVALVDRQPAWSSHLVVIECFSALLRKERKRAITPTHRRRAASQVTAGVAARRLGWCR